MLWAALLLSSKPDGTLPAAEALRGLAVWALQFTPRVTIVDEAVLMEVEASVRLFGGKRQLRDRLRHESLDLGVGPMAWAVTSLAALALARGGIENGFKRPLPDLLDTLPLEALSATAPHRRTLTQLGCHRLGDVRRLPRGGIGRRFDAALLLAMDQAYDQRPTPHRWETLPDDFLGKTELMSRVETAPALLFGARYLLVQLCGWLTARHAGTTAITLRWAHDSMRAKHVGGWGQLSIRTAAATRDIEHLCRLLAENLAKVELEAPVGDLELKADEVHPLAPGSASLLPDVAEKGERLELTLERIAARLGAKHVLRPRLVSDHRLEWMQQWEPADAPRRAPVETEEPMPQPGFIYATPLRLAMRGPSPMYLGPLVLLAGPHRVEGGWWHRTRDDDDNETTLNVQRDYWLAWNERSSFVWVFQERLTEHDAAWYLHGTFA